MSRGLGDVYKRQDLTAPEAPADPVPTSGDPAEVVIDKIYTTGGGFIGVTEG